MMVEKKQNIVHKKRPEKANERRGKKCEENGESRCIRIRK